MYKENLIRLLLILRSRLKPMHSFLSSRLLLFVPIILSIFTHLWNPLGIAALVYDEGTYIGRAMHTLQGNGPQTEPYSDHPYFASLLLAGIFKIVNYPNSLHPSANGDIHSIEMLWLIAENNNGVTGCG